MTLDTAATTTATPEDLRQVEEIVRRSGTSFFWAMRLLPERKRQAMFAIYAYCREIDDIADDPGQTATKRSRLLDWRREIDRLYEGAPSRPISRSLLEPVRCFDLQKEDFFALIDGMEMDAGERLRIADMEELDLYCDRVACAVGRLSNQVFGLDPNTGSRLARALGQALQLTNILRDLDEDARRDRLYLPEDLLSERGIASAGTAANVLDRGAATAVCADIAALAQRRFGEAAAVIDTCNRRQIRPALIMMEIYRRILERLMLRGWQRWAEPVSLPPVEKLWVAVRYGMI